MDIEKLIERLKEPDCDECTYEEKRECAGSAKCVLSGYAAEALSTLRAENEKLRAELEQVKMECDAAKSLLAERIGVRGAEPITTAFGLPLDCLRELAQADREGRCVVLPVPLHKTLLDTSDPYRPELMKDFRISATWTHRGIVFHSPWDIFLENIESGYIRVISAEAQAALRREQDG